eukprot:gnl/MRDRNA2_/MRDRNA2_83617_c0_seq1.p1 gnl/MRDRNA2_/MRDRNA2_83617_c0~~gnl/MRDRNA2_/MRDRNA2_83617_c0_seq1.p1  ORF type:complete len:508 (+),score=46.84 gnl/MRDRNA2_/MRDRNA2_83617_c0_seq1:68-1591(+)
MYKKLCILAYLPYAFSELKVRSSLSSLSAVGQRSPTSLGVTPNFAWYARSPLLSRERTRGTLKTSTAHAEPLAVAFACSRSPLRCPKGIFFPAINRPVAAHKQKRLPRDIHARSGLADSTLNQIRLGPPTDAKTLEQNYGPWVTSLLDSVAEVRVDDNTEDEYWVFPFDDSYRILRKETNVAEIAAGGLAAGIIVEFVVAFLSYPFDTVKTRLQAKPKEALQKYPSFANIYDGFGPVALTVPALAVFWATRDVVRTSIFYFVKQTVPFPVLDTIATGIGATMGEALYWMIKTPSEVIKTRRQAVLMQTVTGRMTQDYNWDRTAPKQKQNSLQTEFQVRDEDSSPMAVKQFKDILRQTVKAWPVLAVADVPYVGVRTSVFLALEYSGLVPSGVAENGFLFLFANTLAAVLTTPLDVLRTQMILRQKAIQELPSVVKELYRNDGLFAFVAGWSPRLVYNGLIIGFLWGFVRQGYDGIRAKILLDVIDRAEDVSSYQDLLRTLFLLNPQP